jgi:asparaginyl-tRNA synthetase
MNYPKAIKAFYMRVNDDGRTVAPTLTLPRSRGRVRVGVICAAMAHGAARRLRPRPGFCRGPSPDVTGLANVRDAIPLPRSPGNARY